MLLQLNINYTLLYTSTIGAFAILLPAMLLHIRELRKMKAQYKSQLKEKETNLKQAERRLSEYEIKTSLFDRIMDIESVNNIKDSASRMFKNTKADRFLILIAMNGKYSPNIVSVIFEQHKESNVKYLASVRYKNVPIDDAYRLTLKRTEEEDYVLFNTNEEENCKLKQFYDLEGVKHSLIKHLIRKPLDGENDFLVYSSIATFNDEPFTSKEKTFITTEYESGVRNNINKVLNSKTNYER